MVIENRTTYLKREILRRLSEMTYTGTLTERVNRIPAHMIKRNAETFRCCFYKDRAILKYRTIASMGFDLGDIEEIESRSLAEFSREIPKRKTPEFPILTFIDDACQACVRANYVVTNVCKNCVARPCIENCPKNCITQDIHQAHIQANDCINCGKCMAVCPYHAIVYVPVPCEEACPVDALYKDENGSEHIDYSKCIYCGKCTKACPFSAIMEKSQIIDIIQHIRAGKEVVAMLAPSVVGQYNADIFQIAKALKQIDFTHIAEVAYGADKTTRTEAAEFIERMEKGDKMLGTSCCPAYVEAVKKHAKQFLPFISDAKTPMSYTAEMVKEEMKDSITVFIGPCVAKKHEGQEDSNVDYVLTFEEMDAMLRSREINPETIEVSEEEKENLFMLATGSILGRGFPTSGGVANAVAALNKDLHIEVKPVLVDGLTRKNVKLLNTYAKKGAPGNLIEVMSCEGGCICGPGVIAKENVARNRLNKFLKGSEVEA